MLRTRRQKYIPGSELDAMPAELVEKIKAFFADKAEIYPDSSLIDNLYHNAEILINSVSSESNYSQKTLNYINKLLVQIVELYLLFLNLEMPDLIFKISDLVSLASQIGDSKVDNQILVEIDEQNPQYILINSVLLLNTTVGTITHLESTNLDAECIISPELMQRVASEYLKLLVQVTQEWEQGQTLKDDKVEMFREQAVVAVYHIVEVPFDERRTIARIKKTPLQSLPGTTVHTLNRILPVYCRKPFKKNR